MIRPFAVASPLWRTLNTRAAMYGAHKDRRAKQIPAQGPVPVLANISHISTETRCAPVSSPRIGPELLHRLNDTP